MVKTNLPVILLREIVLLPNNDIRLEFDNDTSKSIIDVAELFHDNHILVVCQEDPLEESPKLQELPRVGVIAKISHKMELPNGKTRVLISGQNRACIHEYMNFNRAGEVLESIVSPILETEIEEREETVLVRKLYREMEAYVKSIPYVSNSVLALITNQKSLSKVTDVIVPHLPLELPRLKSYLEEESALKRTQMILADLYQGKEMFLIEKELDLKVKEGLDSNQREYLLREKLKLIKEELGEAGIKEDDADQIREKIETGNFSDKVRNRLEEELRRYEALPSSSPEVTIVRNYLDWLMSLPWGVYTKDREDLKEVHKQLDESHFGLDKIKTRIIEFLAVKQQTNQLHGPILCLVGPPGVGKTSLAIQIAQAIDRNFVKISVGGVNDEAEIMGHRRTYLGASPGRIIQSMKKAKSANPLFLIDEIDKMTKDYKGDPASALLEILDPEQNKFFSDNYIEEEFDLSHVMFITTANDVDQIPEPLKDRLEILELSGYTEYEKVDIALHHLIPKTSLEHGLDPAKVIFSRETLLKIIRGYTKEAGVREFGRQISTIVRKIVTMLVMNQIKIEKVIVHESDLEKYLGKEKYPFFGKKEESLIGVVNGLAYTPYGGDILPMEVNYYPGKGDFVLTGSLGDVMKESAHIAFSYIKANAKQFGIAYDLLTENDIHIHVPEGAIPKDGPSAGITLTTALISAFTKQKIESTLAMTGEITLRGNILPIGGLKEKSIGAHRNGIKTILYPFDNQKDLEEVPTEIRETITFLPVRTYYDVLAYLKKNSPSSKKELVREG